MHPILRTRRTIPRRRRSRRRRPRRRCSSQRCLQTPPPPIAPACCGGIRSSLTCCCIDCFLRPGCFRILAPQLRRVFWSQHGGQLDDEGARAIVLCGGRRPGCFGRRTIPLVPAPRYRRRLQSRTPGVHVVLWRQPPPPPTHSAARSIARCFLTQAHSLQRKWS